MPTPREIIDQRLATGEITLEQHRELIGAIQSAPTDTISLPPRPAKQEVPASSSGKAEAKSGSTAKTVIRWAVIGVAIVVILNVISGMGGGVVKITNVRTEGWFIPTISGTILNDGPSGNVWIWFEQNGKKMCARQTYMLANSQKNFSFDCHDMNEGNFRSYGSKSPPGGIGSAPGI